MTLMQVVLPEPLGPTRPRTSPACRWKVTPSRARKPPKRFTRPSTVRSGSGDTDASGREQGDEAVGEEQHQKNDQGAVGELEVLRHGDADDVVDAVENEDAQQRAGEGGCAAEQKEDGGEDRDA